MVRLDAVDMAVQPHPPACGLSALRICRGAADRVANRGADVQRAEHPPGQPLCRAGLRHRCAAESWSRRPCPRHDVTSKSPGTIEWNDESGEVLRCLMRC